MIHRNFHITDYMVADNISLHRIELVLYINEFPLNKTDGRYMLDGSYKICKGHAIAHMELANKDLTEVHTKHFLFRYELNLFS